VRGATEDDGTEPPELVGMGGAVCEGGWDAVTDEEWTGWGIRPTVSKLSKCLSNSAWDIDPSLTRRAYSPMSFLTSKALGSGPVSVVSAGGVVMPNAAVDAIWRSLSSIPATTRGECSIHVTVAYFDKRLRTSSRSVATGGSAYASIPASRPKAVTTFYKNQQI
jgi:hypothetical protein